jgi:hypothetical protein
MQDEDLPEFTDFNLDNSTFNFNLSESSKVVKLNEPCQGCIEIDQRCTNPGTGEINYDDPSFPYFENCGQVQPIGPTYVNVDKNLICTGETFTITFNVINLTGSKWESIPPNSPNLPTTEADAYATLQIYATTPNPYPSCLEIAYLNSNHEPFSIMGTVVEDDAIEDDAIPVYYNNILSIGWLFELDNGAEKTFTATFQMTGDCTCPPVPSVEPPSIGDVAITAEVIRGCNVNTCYKCKECPPICNIPCVEYQIAIKYTGCCMKIVNSSQSYASCFCLVGNGTLYADITPSCQVCDSEFEIKAIWSEDGNAQIIDLCTSSQYFQDGTTVCIQIVPPNPKTCCDCCGIPGGSNPFYTGIYDVTYISQCLYQPGLSFTKKNKITGAKKSYLNRQELIKRIKKSR